MAKLIVGPLQRGYGSVDMSKSTGQFAIAKPKLVALEYPSSILSASDRTLPTLGGTNATKMKIDNDGQLR